MKKRMLALMLAMTMVILCMPTFSLSVFAEEEKEIDSIYAYSLGTYYENDPIDLTYAEIAVYYKDGTSEYFPITADMVSNLSTEKAGYNYPTVTYKGFSDTSYYFVKHKYVTVGDEEICSVCGTKKTIESLGTVYLGEYYEDDVALDLTGRTMYVSYNDNESDYLHVTEDMITDDCPMGTVGRCEVTINYKGEKTTGYYYIRHNWIEDGENQVCSVCGFSRPANFNYFYVRETPKSSSGNGVYWYEGEEIDYSSGSIEVCYTDGHSETIPMNKDMITGVREEQIKLNRVDEVCLQSITVSYYGETSEFMIKRLHKFEKVNGVYKCSECGYVPDAYCELVSPPSNTVYYDESGQGCYFYYDVYNLDGCVINVCFSDGTSKTIDCSKDLYYSGHTENAVSGVGFFSGQNTGASDDNPDFYILDFRANSSAPEMNGKLCFTTKGITQELPFSRRDTNLNCDISSIELIDESYDEKSISNVFSSFLFNLANNALKDTDYKNGSYDKTIDFGNFIYCYTEKCISKDKARLGQEVIGVGDGPSSGLVYYYGDSRYYAKDDFETEAAKYFDISRELNKNYSEYYGFKTSDDWATNYRINYDAEKEEYSFIEYFNWRDASQLAILGKCGYIVKGNNYEIYFETEKDIYNNGGYETKHLCNLLTLEYDGENIRFISLESVDSMPEDNPDFILINKYLGEKDDLIGKTLRIIYDNGSTKKVTVSEDMLRQLYYINAVKEDDNSADYTIEESKIGRLLNVDGEFFTFDFVDNPLVLFHGKWMPLEIVNAETMASLIELTNISNYTAEEYDEIGEVIEDIVKETSVEKFLENFENPVAELKIVNDKGTEITTGTIATGYKLQLIVDEKVVDEKVLIVNGDNSGDGIVDVVDVKLALNTSLGKEPLTGVYSIATEVSGDGIIDVVDVKLILNVSLGKQQTFEAA